MNEWKEFIKIFFHLLKSGVVNAINLMKLLSIIIKNVDMVQSAVVIHNVITKLDPINVI